MAKNGKLKIKKDKGQITVYTVYFCIFLIFSFICLYPLFFCFINSMKSVAEFYEEGGLYKMPDNWGLTYYVKIFQTFKIGAYDFWDMAFNSIWQAFGSQGLNILASMMIAYPLARYNFPGKGFIYGIIIFRITIPVIGAGAAAYKLMRDLSLVKNPLYIITYFAGFDMQALIMYGYFKGISKEYSEAAFMDGANCLQVLFKVVFPQAFPCVLALYISAVMGAWNNYTTPQIYWTNYPNLALGIYEFELSSLSVEGGKPMFFGAVMMSALVPLTLFSAGQKLMLTNMSVGGLKG
jgi:multiple sugar transport system permease protein